MHIAVMGAGAVGCYYGALLARAGHHVTLIGRPALVDQVRNAGLLLESSTFTGPVDLQADTDPAAVRDAALVLCCVKSGDTETAARHMAPHLKNVTTVLSLQNGVDNATRLSQALACPVIPAVVYVAVDMAGPGHVRHHGRGDLLIGPSPTSMQIASDFTTAGIPTEVSDTVLTALWSKLVINCVYNALSAIAQQPYARLVRGPGVARVMRNAFDECVAVAISQGITLPDSLWQDTLVIAQTMPGQRSSTAQDLARGKPSEIDHLNGTVARLGLASDIATPVNHSLWCAVKLLEDRHQPGA